MSYLYQLQMENRLDSVNDTVREALEREQTRNDLINTIISNPVLKGEVEYMVRVEKLTKLLSPIPAIKGHTIDMEIDGKKIYHILGIYQEYFTEKFAIDFAEDIPSLEAKIAEIDKNIKTMKMDDRSASGDNSSKEHIIRDDYVNNANYKGVHGITYVRNVHSGDYITVLPGKEGYQVSQDRYQDIVRIIDEMQIPIEQGGLALCMSEAIRFFVLRMGFGLYGRHINYDEFADIGSYGILAVGPRNLRGSIPTLVYNDMLRHTKLRLGGEINGIPQLSEIAI